MEGRALSGQGAWRGTKGATPCADSARLGPPPHGDIGTVETAGQAESDPSDPRGLPSGPGGSHPCRTRAFKAPAGAVRGNSEKNAHRNRRLGGVLGAFFMLFLFCVCVFVFCCVCFCCVFFVFLFVCLFCFVLFAVFFILGLSVFCIFLRFWRVWAYFSGCGSTLRRESTILNLTVGARALFLSPSTAPPVLWPPGH